MGNIIMREQWVNQTEGHMLGETEWYEAYTDDEGELFRALQRDAGRCTGKVYVDTDEEDARPVGWVFIRKEKYTDVDEYYLRETWIDLKHRYQKGD